MPVVHLPSSFAARPRFSRHRGVTGSFQLQEALGVTRRGALNGSLTGGPLAAGAAWKPRRRGRPAPGLPATAGAAAALARRRAVGRYAVMSFAVNRAHAAEPKTAA